MGDVTKRQEAVSAMRQAARELSNLTFNVMQSRESVKVDPARATQFMEAVAKFDRADERLSAIDRKKESHRG